MAMPRNSLARRRPTWSHIWPMLVLCIVLFALVCAPFARGRVYADLDHQFLSTPYRVIYHDALAAGEWGWWGPHYFRGFSLLGVGQPGLLHPWRYAMAKWLPVELAVPLDMVLILPLTFLGAWWLLRHYRFAWPAAVTGAGLWASSIFFSGSFGHTHMITIFGHAPWVMLAYEGIGHPRWRPWALLALGLLLASMFLLGHPHTVWLVALLVAVATLAHGLRARWTRAYWQHLGLAALTVLAGLLIGMLQLLPTLALLQANPRGHLTAAEHGNYSLHPFLLLQNLSPMLFTEQPGDLVYMPDQPPFYLSNPNVSSAYFGAALLAFVAAGLGLYWQALRRRRQLPLVALLLAALAAFSVLAMGRYGGLHGLLWYLPGLSAFRTPHRYASVMAGVLTLLAVLLLDHLWRSPPPRPTPRQWAWLGVVFAPFLLAFITGALWPQLTWRGHLLTAAAPWPRAWGVLAAGLALWLFALALRGWQPARGLLALVLLADLGGFGIHLLATTPTRPLADVQQFAITWQTNNRTYRTLSPDDAPVWIGALLCRGTEGLTPIEALDYGDRQHIRLAAVKTFQAGNRQGELPDSLPRFRLVPRLEQVDEPLANLQGVDLAQVARMAPAPGLTPLSGPPLAATEVVSVTYDGYDHLACTVTVAQPRLLVVADQWDRDWHATVDGAPTPLLPLFKGAVRGVIVPAGTHAVAMTYVPAALYRAIPFAGCGALLLLSLVGAVWWRGRQRGKVT